MIFRHQKLSLREESDLFLKLSMYIVAGLSLGESISLIRNQARSLKRKRELDAWYTAIDSGKTFTYAISHADKPIVSNSSIAIIELGEKSGSLSVSLKSASEYVKKRMEIQKKVISAMIYPLLVLVGTSFLVLGLMLFIFPKIIPLFVSLKVPLPLSTRILIVVTNVFLQHWLFLIILIFSICGLIYFVLKKSAWAKQKLQILIIRMPFLKTLIKTKILSEIFSSVNVLCRAGEQLDMCLRQTSRSQFYEYEVILRDAAILVSEGGSFSEFVDKRPDFFSSFIPGLISVGERTGNLETALRDISEILRVEFEDKIKALSVSLEPILMVLMSLAVGFVAISIILPIYGITSHFQNV